MNTPVIEGNCGTLCNYHCCRKVDETGDRLGMYLLPLEYEYMQAGKVFDFEIHPSSLYEMPPRIRKLYYIYCHEKEGCLRDFRPIQCRTYPFEPHIMDNELYLVIEKEQIHHCPLLNDPHSWKPEFIEGVYRGWELLLEIPLIRYFIQYESNTRTSEDNFKKFYHPHKGWL